MTRTEAVHWLHILETGEEVCYPAQPEGLPTLRVSTTARRSGYVIEETMTRIITMTDGDKANIVEPRGRGWRFNGVVDQSAKWIRKRPHD